MRITISLRILDVDEETLDFTLLSNCHNNDSITWSKDYDSDTPGHDFMLEIVTNIEMTTILSIERGKGIQSSEQEIKDLFLEALFEANIKRQLDEADGFEHFNNNSENNEHTPYPYDPKLIRVDTKPFSVEHVCKLINSKKLDIFPDFQRGFVWTEITRKSQLIESIMLRIPLPVFYLSQDDEGKYQVVDGIQRLTVINDFVNNKFKLKNLEYLTELDGKWFRRDDKPADYSIPALYSGRIEETQLFFNIIDPSTPEQVKYDVFRRINTGGKTLNAQEIRNCLSSESTRHFLHEMVSSEEFINATNNSITSTRMADSEIALRFVGFYLLDNIPQISLEYKGDMDEFLDQVNSQLNKLDENVKSIILNDFRKAMKNAHIMFGNKAFRRSTHINKALFLSWSRHLYEVNSDILKKQLKNINAYEILIDKINHNDKYSKAISGGTNDLSSINISYEFAKDMIKEIMNK